MRIDESEYTVLATSDCPTSKFKKFKTKGLGKDEIGAAEVFFERPLTYDGRVGHIGGLWMAVIQKPFIPFDPVQRGALLKRVLRILKQFVELNDLEKTVRKTDSGEELPGLTQRNVEDDEE